MKSCCPRRGLSSPEKESENENIIAPMNTTIIRMILRRLLLRKRAVIRAIKSEMKEKMMTGTSGISKNPMRKTMKRRTSKPKK
jgi:hypothetical protein